jgi:DNA-binding transcriptional ArsR family regulator
VDAVFKALEAPRRRELLRLVWQAELGAGELRRANPDVTFGAVSQHMRLLQRAGLVEARQLGRRRFYKARPEALGPLRAWLESTWADALSRLKLAAELEEAHGTSDGHAPRRKPARNSARGARKPARAKQQKQRAPARRQPRRHGRGDARA